MADRERIERLQSIFASYDADTTFTEEQAPRRGGVLDDDAIDARLAARVAEMRERYGFRTSLDDVALVAVVRGFYDGTTDAELGADLGTGAGVVARARANLHLLRPADLDAPFELSRLARLLEGGATVGEAAAELGVSETAAGRYAHLLSVRDAARRSGYRHPGEFEELLGVADEARIAATLAADRRTMADVWD